MMSVSRQGATLLRLLLLRLLLLGRLQTVSLPRMEDLARRVGSVMSQTSTLSFSLCTFEV